MRRVLVNVLMALALALPATTALVAVTEVPSFAHTVNNAHGKCDGVYAHFDGFPGGKHVITITVGAKPIAHTSFTGHSGDIFVKWSDFTPPVPVSEGGTFTFVITWTDDGGGTSGPVDFDASGCVPTVHETVCRNGETVNLTIPPDSRQPGDTDGACPPPTTTPPPATTTPPPTQIGTAESIPRSSATPTVAAAPVVETNALPRTGSPLILPLLLIGIVLVVGGSVVLHRSSKRTLAEVHEELSSD